MKLVTFSRRSHVSIGKVVGADVVDLGAVAGMRRTMRAFLEAGPALLKRAAALGPDDAPTYPLSDLRLEAPVEPSKYLAIGLNYKDHVAEARQIGFQVPDSQVWFNKQVSCINAPYGDVHKPGFSDMVDYEAELGVVIGRRCHRIGADEARRVVAGYLVCNDVSVRDWQRRSPTMQLGKSFNTHGPIGPWIVTADEIADPHALEIRMAINGELRQRASTGQMIHDIWQQIAYLSTVMTLEPGDVIATGTPSGVGAAMDPPQWLKVGDVMRVDIEGIGHIENRVVAEPF